MAKIKKSRLKEFFGYLGKKNKPKDIQALIDNDPKIKKLEKDIEQIQKKHGSLSPKYQAMLKKYGAI